MKYVSVYYDAATGGLVRTNGEFVKNFTFASEQEAQEWIDRYDVYCMVGPPTMRPGIMIVPPKETGTICSCCGEVVEDDEIEQCPCCGEDVLCSNCLDEAAHSCTGKTEDEPYEEGDGGDKEGETR